MTSGSGTNSARSDVVDICKGLGICLVVVGHSSVFAEAHPLLNRAIYLFHMPLFFFLAGVFLKGREPLASFTVRKLDAILKPYIVVTLCYAVWLCWRDQSTCFEQLSGIAYGVGDSLYIRPLWFLPHLLLVTVVTNQTIKWLDLGERTAGREIMAWLISGLLIVAGYLWLNSGIPARPLASLQLLNSQPPAQLQGWPWSLDLLPLSAGFALLGYLSAGHKGFSRPSSYQEPILVAAICVILLTSTAAQLNLDDRQVHQPLIALLLGLAGIRLTWVAASYLARTPLPISKPLAQAGQASLIVLMFHPHTQGWVVHRMQQLHAPPGLTIAVGIATGLCVPMIIWFACQRSQLLHRLLLPARRGAPQPQLAPNSPSPSHRNA